MTGGINRTIYPVGLLLEDRPCLIIGGGKVAARKAEGLLAAKANVTVISPEISASLTELYQEERIQYIARTYQTGDTQGFILVFAATGDRHTNKMVLKECQSHKIPCCPVDGNWMEGDFVTPATIRKGHLSVAISTGGQNCRRSRLIKENLSRHIDMVDSANLVVMGTSHHELPLEYRESLHQNDGEQQQIAGMLMQIWGVHEFMILNTCNRIELWAVKAEGQAIEDLLIKIMGFADLKPDNMYIKTGFDAFEHAALLASGLLSQATGEVHIVAQIKQALKMANDHSWSGGVLAQWMGAALHISKRIRNHIFPNEKMREIEDSVMAFLQHIGITPMAKVVVIGTGTVGQSIAKKLATRKIPFDWIFYKNPPNQVTNGARIQPFHALAACLASATHVISAVRTDAPIIQNPQKSLLGERKVFLIDLSVPRSIDINPAPKNIEILDLEGLKSFKRQQSPISSVQRTESQQIIKQHIHLYDQMLSSFENLPT